jgi:hypothetical protein
MLPRVASILLCASLAACGGEGQPSASGTPTCTAPIEATDLSKVPPSLPRGQLGIITKVETRAGFIGVETVTDEQIVELYPKLVRDLDEAGYTFLGGDNEGFEAEIAFFDPQKRNVTFIIRMGQCDDVHIQVLIQAKDKG